MNFPFILAAGPERTPRANRDLPQRLGEFSTLAEGLDYAARGETGFNFYSGRGSLEHVLPYANLRERALTTGRRLKALGMERGQRVAVVAETGPDFMSVFFGCQYAGLIPCPLPYAMHIGGREQYVERLAGMLASSGASVAVSPEDLRDHVGEAARRSGTGTVLTFDELAQIDGRSAALDPLRADEAAYIQYSSGSTSEPKGILIDQRAIVANSRAILVEGLRVTRHDRGFSWLPLYHDMGLVGFCLAPMMGQVTIDYLPTAAFARRPALWLRLMSDNRSTVAYAPSFGYELAVRRINGEAASLDLRAWRVAGIGGDMVRPDVLDLFAEKLGVAGFDPRAFVPSYGMAETTLAITMAALDEPVRVDTIDRVQCKLSRRAVPVSPELRGDLERARSFVVCGRPIGGFEIEIRDGRGRKLREREIGQIFVRGPGLMSGYFGNSAATRLAVGKDGFLDTGDMGYWLDGEIVIAGRAKDLILHNGRNIWPQDIEWAVERLDPVREGDVAAFAMEGEGGEDEVIVLVQCRLASALEREDLRRRAAAVVHRQAGVECEVVLVPPKSLPFTSSGKLSRAGAKAGYLAGEIAELDGHGRKPDAAPALLAAE